MTQPIEDDELTALSDADIPRVDLVGKGANGVPRFLIAKRSDGAAGLLAPDFVRDLIAKADPTPASEDTVTMTGSPAAIAKLIHGAPVRDDVAPGIEVSKDMADVLDVTDVLAEPEENLPGADTTPGSPAWEAVDAATARKWTSILSRAKGAVGLLAERERLEAAGGDCEDAEAAWDLEDAACAIDYAISVLAPFAVEEQAEAEQGADELNGVRKALGGWDPQALDTIEALGQVRKAGRVLSAGNEAAIRGAVDSLQKVLASLPQAPVVEKSGQPVAEAKESNVSEPVVKTDPAPQPADPQAPAQPDAPTLPAEPVAKADGEGDVKPQMVAVYDASGNLVGVVDPGDITAVQGAKPKEEPAAEEPAEAAPASPDLTPAAPDSVGTPADAVPDDVNKQTLDTDAVAKALAVAVKEHLDAATATQGESLAEMAGVVKALQDRINALEEQPAQPRVFTNGAVPPTEQLRGQNRGSAPVDIAKARELKGQLSSGDAAMQNAAFTEMQQLAIARYQQMTGIGQ